MHALTGEPWPSQDWGVAELLEKLNTCVDKAEFDRWLFFLGSRLSRSMENGTAAAAAGVFGEMALNYYNIQTVRFAR